jgi:hypothetical protein
MAAQDGGQSGVPTVQLYAHRRDSRTTWIAPTSLEQDKKLDEIAAKKGLKTGVPGSIEFRQLLASHTDTFAAGPTSASELMAQATK